MKKRTIIIITVVLLILAGIAGSFQKNNISESNTNQLDLQANINPVGMTFYPDPKGYAEIYHLPDNPNLQIISISGDYSTIQLTDEYGNTYIGRSCDGWNNPNTWSQTAFAEGFVQYLFDDSQPFYGMTLHGFNNGQFFIAAQLKEHSNTFLDPMYNLK